ncbi:hypothetical protein CXG50_19275 [Pseudomonas plecoglossicida]|uniref:hypothetical protein n=1 Tax=Pseudomonas TaxID=286 RepID=UPI0002A16DF2|nr:MULTISPECIES: hypothetical protein [Pseudomonas]AGA74840.1 hypothetical protein B479_19740 [Pseudomonas putida HB3267]MCE0756907.1 hypothetical protein [Pseudomonas asiatica]MCE0945181.1 hypothetical protein [Pseudomonas asiatica]MCE0956785.1 hypothetical protein [Pseudomonas asiatica]MCE1032464.1 hypothetical protein [Pseudomonas asiatica]
MNIKIAALLLLALCAQPAWSQSYSYSSETPAAKPAESAAMTTRMALRDLWVEHIFWVRNHAVANQAGNAKEAEVAAKEVVTDATRIANSIAPLYGQPAADQLLKLLAGHWGAIKHYSDATVAKDKKGQQAAVNELNSNAKAIAAFLAKANPNLPEPTLLTLLSAHGGHHVAQIDQLAAADYVGEARTWAMMREHILTLSDALAAALVKQFPDKF